MSIPSFDWVLQESTGTYERPFASSEAAYGVLLHYFDKSSTYCCGVSFEASNIPRETVIAAVKDAIVRFRFHAPIIACDRKVYGDQPLRQSFVYKPVSSAEGAIAWAEEILTIEASDHNLKEYMTQRCEMRVPYVHSDGREQYFGCTLVLHENGRYSFIGHVGHGFMDGRPHMSFIRFVLDTIVSPEKGENIYELAWGAEWKNLPDFPATLAQRNAQLTDCDWNKGWKELQDKIDGIFDRKELGESFKPSKPSLAGPMVRTFHQIDEEGLTAIKNELKKIGFTMAILISAAHILAVFDKNQPIRPDSYVTLDTTIIDTVRFFPQSHSGPLKVSSRSALIPLVIEAKDIDWDATLRDQLICIMNILDKQTQDYLRYPQLTLVDAVGPRKLDVAPLHPQTCILSYIGVVEMVLPRIIPEEAANAKVRLVDFSVMHRHAGGLQRPSQISWCFQGTFYTLMQGTDIWDAKYYENVLNQIVAIMLQLVPGHEGRST